MDNATIIEFTGRDVVTDPLTDLLRKGARDLLQAAVEAERDAFLAEFAERRTLALRFRNLANPGKSLFYIDLLKFLILNGHFQCVVMVKKP